MIYCKRIEGSNPSLSASIRKRHQMTKIPTITGLESTQPISEIRRTTYRSERSGLLTGVRNATCS